MSYSVQWSTYPFRVCQHGDPWNDVGGIYIFTGLNQQNQWVPLYIGQTDSFYSRIPWHEKWDMAVRRGATHVHAMVVEHVIQRVTIETELIQRYSPVLNKQEKNPWTQYLSD
jgi:hypothetical protein